MKKILMGTWLGGAGGDAGYFLLRVFIGAGMMTHGLPKLAGGVETWRGVGGIMSGTGMPGAPEFWGFMAAAAEGIGGILLMLGACTVPASFLIVVTMAVAAFVAHAGAPFAGREMALLYLFPALLFMLKGGGRWSLDVLIAGRKKG